MHLSAQHLHYSYLEANREHTVLEDVSLDVLEGERVALLGSSGSGKSTLLNVLGGIDQVDSGKIVLQGRALEAMGEPELTLFRRENIGFIYQQFNLIPTLTVIENISLPLELLGQGTSQRREIAGRWLESVGLEERGDAFPDQLSGGEQQRVAIARALVHEPRLVLADEPTGNLDAETGEKVLQLLFDLARDQKQTLLVVTHSRAVAERSDRVLVLSKGRLQGAGDQLAW